MMYVENRHDDHPAHSSGPSPIQRVGLSVSSWHGIAKKVFDSLIGTLRAGAEIRTDVDRRTSRPQGAASLAGPPEAPQGETRKATAAESRVPERCLIRLSSAWPLGPGRIGHGHP